MNTTSETPETDALENKHLSILGNLSEIFMTMRKFEIQNNILKSIIVYKDIECSKCAAKILPPSGL